MYVCMHDKSGQVTSQSFYDVMLWFVVKKEATFLFCVMVLPIFDQIYVYSWLQSLFWPHTFLHQRCFCLLANIYYIYIHMYVYIRTFSGKSILCICIIHTYVCIVVYTVRLWRRVYSWEHSWFYYWNCHRGDCNSINHHLEKKETQCNCGHDEHMYYIHRHIHQVEIREGH